MQQHEDHMDNLAYFPGTHRREDGEETLRATAERLDDSAASGDEVIDGEVVEPSTELEPRKPVLPPALVETAATVGTAAWRCARRNSVITLKGVEQQRLLRKTEREQADLKAARRMAAEQGDYTQVREINKQIMESKLVSVEAWRARAEVIASITKKAAVALAIISGVAVVTGTINSFGDWLGPWDGLDVLYLLGSLVAGVFYTLQFAVENWLWLAPSLMATTAGVWLSRRWRDGKRLGEQVLPVELRNGEAVQHVELDESTLVSALANIGIPALKEMAKEGWPNRPSDRAWVQFPILDGNGMLTKLRLPLGAPVEKVQKAKVTLAHNLGCLPAELWLDKDDTDPTVLDLFRLNPGELRKPVPEYPLLHDGVTDYFKGFPVGISPRGQEIIGVTFERNYVISGIMGSGKSTLVLDLVGGAILDPLVDIDVFVFAENADYDAFKPCFNTFVMGDTAENVEACQDHIAELHADLARRGRLLQKHNVTEVNREVAAKEPGLRPRIVVIDECQSFFRQDKPEDRRAVVNQMVRFFSAARKYGITCVFVTPVPSDQSLPRDLVSVATNRACFAIGDKTRNNVVLGDKAHENGISALGLKPKDDENLNDVGTSITVGFTPVNGTTLRSYHMNRAQQEQLVERALQLRSGVSTEEPEERDLLTDVLAVIGDDATPAGKVMAAMRSKWTFYQGWKIETLVNNLKDEGVHVPSTGNTYPIKPATVRDIHGRRDAQPDTEAS